VRVALVTHNIVRGDGQGRVNFELARHALRRGVDLTLVADRVDEELLELGAEWLAVHPRRSRPQLLKVKEFAAGADRVLGRQLQGVDVVHANGFVLSRPHHVNTSHAVHGAGAALGSDAPPLRRAYEWLYARLNAVWERRAYSRAQLVTAVSEHVLGELGAIGVPAERLRLIRNGVDLREFCPGEADRSELGLPENVPLVLFVGDVRSRRKNLDTVIRALVSAPELRLVVVGRAPSRRFPELAERLGVDNRVYFLGYRDDVHALMRAADVLAAPSRYDSCPLVALEALASGLPVVTAVTSGAAEIVTPDCGVVVDNPEDAGALAAALRSVATDARRRRNLGARAREVASAHSWTAMAENYLSLYREIAA
jgi:glycosyltransferase involved in cell wall biosynthesis